MIPQGIKNLLNSEGVKVKVGPMMSSIYPELAHTHPRGWPNEATFDSVPAYYNDTTNQIIVAEKTVHPFSKAITLNDNPVGYLVHEIGHAVDDSLGHLSETSTFVNAFESDKAGIPAESKTILDYFLQSGHAGPQEAFAEGFATALGVKTPFSDLFQSFFPKVMGFIDTHVLKKFQSA
jgi:hypothetical protein